MNELCALQKIVSVSHRHRSLVRATAETCACDAAPKPNGIEGCFSRAGAGTPGGATCCAQRAWQRMSQARPGRCGLIAPCSAAVRVSRRVSRLVLLLLPSLCARCASCSALHGPMHSSSTLRIGSGSSHCDSMGSEDRWTVAPAWRARARAPLMPAYLRTFWTRRQGRPQSCGRLRSPAPASEASVGPAGPGCVALGHACPLAAHRSAARRWNRRHLRAQWSSCMQPTADAVRCHA